MADKATPGQPIRTGPLSKAAFVNDLVDVVAAHKRNALGRGVQAMPLNLPPVSIRNDTGDDLRRGEVVQLGETLLDELNPQALWFAGSVVAAPADLKFGIALAPIKSTEIGPAAVVGVCIAIVNVSDILHTHAVPFDGEKTLRSATAGPFEILSPLAVEFEQETAVRFLSGGLDTCDPQLADLDQHLPESGDFVLGLRDGCLTLIPITFCGGSSGGLGE